MPVQGRPYDRSTPPGAPPRKGGELPKGAGGVTRRIIGWRLGTLERKAPADALAELLPAGAPASADTLARARAFAASAHLPAGAVAEHVWEGSDKREDDVAALAAEAPGSFLAAEALALRGATVGAIAALARAALSDTSDTATRLRLLHTADVADTLAAIHGAATGVAALQTLLDDGLAAAAAAFAAAGKLAAVGTLLSRHPRTLAHSAPAILAALPPTADANDTAAVLCILDGFAASPPTPPREADAAEYYDALSAAPPETWLTEWALYGTELPAAETIDAWAIEHAVSITDELPLMQHTLAFLKAWSAASGRDATRSLVGIVHMWLVVAKHSEADIAAEFAGARLRDVLALTPPEQLRRVLRALVPTGMALDEAAEMMPRVRFDGALRAGSLCTRATCLPLDIACWATASR